LKQKPPLYLPLLGGEEPALGGRSRGKKKKAAERRNTPAMGKAHRKID